MLKLKKIPAQEYGKLQEGGRYLPGLNLDSKQVPEIKDWEVGETYQIVLEIKQTSKSENNNDKDGKENNTRADFDITAYKILDDYENMSDGDMEELQGEALSNK